MVDMDTNLQTSGLTEEQIKILEELNQISIRDIISSENFELSDKVAAAKKGGKVRASMESFKDINNYISNETRSKGGKISGNQNVESGHWQKVAFEPTYCEHCHTTYQRCNYKQFHGEFCVFSVININDVRNDLLEGMSMPDVEKKYRIGNSTIRKIKKGYYGNGKYPPIKVDSRRTKRVCPHCNTTGTKSNHFDNCQFKNGKLEKIQTMLSKGYSISATSRYFGLDYRMIKNVKDGKYGK